MAYVLLALGVVMSLVGLAAMVVGYPMIEIERGWATVITGAVLLSGGLVVAALGFVVRHLVGLRRALASAGGLPRYADEPIPQPEVVPTPLMPSERARPILPRTEAAPLSRPLAPSFAAPPFAAPPFAAPVAAAVPVAAAAIAAGTAYAHEAPAPNPTYEIPPPELPVAEPHPAGEHAPELAPDEPVSDARVPDAHVPEAYVPEVHIPEIRSPGPPEPEPAAAAEPSRPKSGEDWLDQAFSAFDYEMTNGHPPTGAMVPPAAAHPPEPAPIEPAAPEPKPAAAHADIAPPDELHEPAPHVAHEPASEHEEHVYAAEAPATAPAEPDANLTVIGRYDSEGTSYVMYSDGSIEAQSEAGVYRFGSMAELKAFIEG